MFWCKKVLYDWSLSRKGYDVGPLPSIKNIKLLSCVTDALDDKLECLLLVKLFSPTHEYSIEKYCQGQTL
jgi:hypothetical protein